MTTRRYLTVMFSDLVGSTRLSTIMEFEEHRAFMKQLHALYLDVIAEYGGDANQIQGDGVYGFFGYPEADELTVERAIDAALEMHDRAREFAIPVSPGYAQLSTGIHTGLVLVTAGDGIVGGHELFGEAPNVTARLASLAGQDEILVSDSSLSRHRERFALGRARSETLKGIEGTLLAWPVVGRKARTRKKVAAKSRTPFLGRNHERQLICEFLAGGSEAFSALAVVGAAGLGKTRLVDEALGDANTTQGSVHRGFSERRRGVKALQPLRQMAAALSQSVVSDDATVSALLTACLGPNAQDERGKCFVDLFAHMAASCRQVLFVDDFQWVDDATLDVLTQLAARECDVRLVVTSRPDSRLSMLTFDFERLSLADLERADVEGIAGHLLDHVDPFIVEEILSDAGGNPLFVEEVCNARRHASEGEDWAGRRPGERVGSWIPNLIGARLSQLTSISFDVVRTASVIALSVDRSLIGSVTELAIEQDTLDELARNDLMYLDESGQDLSFKHRITQEVVYESLGKEERELLHDRVAQVLATLTPQAESVLLAHHHFEAGNDEKAAHYAEKAGDEAMAVGALDRADSSYQLAITALRRGGMTENVSADRWSGLVKKLVWVSSYDPALAAVDELAIAIEHSQNDNDTQAVAQAEFWTAWVYYALGASPASMLHGERAVVAASTAGASGLVVEAEALLGQSLTIAGRYDEALDRFSWALGQKRARREQENMSPGTAYSLACRALIEAEQGDFARAQESLNQARDVVSVIDHPLHGSILGHCAIVALWHGRWHQAVEAAQQAQVVSQKTGSRYVMAINQALEAYGAYQLDGSHIHRDRIRRAQTWLVDRDQKLFLSLVYGWLADISADNEDFDDVLQWAGKARELSSEGDLLGAAMAHRAEARCAWYAGDFDAAQRLLHRADSNARQRSAAHELAHNALLRGELMIERRQRQALAFLEDAQTRFTALDMPAQASKASQLIHGA